MVDVSVIDLPSLFHDVSPIPQDDGPYPVCAIDYKPAFVECMNYLRAVMYANELSERSLKLTTICLKHNPANYTTWHFRRQCMAHLSQTSANDETGNSSSSVNHPKFKPQMVRDDLRLAAQLGGSNPKNYQIWYHRRALLEPALKSQQEEEEEEDEEDDKEKEVSEEEKEFTSLVHAAAREELSYVENVLLRDAKNYHAWSHRQWIIRCIDHEDFWKDEVKYCDQLILDDIRNNSAWNHRWFAVHRGNTYQLPLEPSTAQDEAAYAFAKAALDPFNESSWRYLLGLIEQQEEDDKKVLVEEYEAKVQALLESQDMKDLLAEDEDGLAGCSNAMSAHVDLLQWKGDAVSCTKAADMCHELAMKYDKIRLKYWLFREKELRQI